MPGVIETNPGPTRSLESEFNSSGWPITLKYVTDFIISCVLLVLLAPLIVLSAALVWLTSGGPVIYSQARVGRNGKWYHIYKLRTMIHNCETLTGPKWSTPGDPRITPVGRFLRKTHLDELPQLWNVLRGEMSLVGPRPERPEFANMLGKAIPHYGKRLVLRPGVTGIAQVQLPGDTDLESVQRKLAYDLYYVKNLSPWLDLRIILGTCFKVLGIPFRRIGQWCALPRFTTVQSHFEREFSSAIAGGQESGELYGESCATIIECTDSATTVVALTRSPDNAPITEPWPVPVLPGS
jgi:lipopolysaccharide/colanic/teichoic acid biosynthesis glycosyltransferase